MWLCHIKRNANSFRCAVLLLCQFGGGGLCSSKRVGSSPIKNFIDDEVSGDVRHASPGIVGRLMGLDTMPSFGVHSHSTYSGTHSQIMSPGSSCDKHGFSGDVPHKRSTDEILEFKDVFEVMEAARMKTQSLSSGCTNIHSGLEKVNSAGMNFVRQKFMDAKCLSTKESFHRSKEFNGALKALVSNKDLLLEFLQESNHVPMKDCTNLSCYPFSAVNRITVLKPSRRNKFVDADIIYPPEDTKRACRAPNGVKHSPRKPCVNHSSQSPEEDTVSFRQNVSRSSFKERIDTHSSPTHIVVLKPCLDKTENMEGAFPLTHEMFQSSYRKPEAPLDYGNATQSPHTEEYMYFRMKALEEGKVDVFLGLPSRSGVARGGGGKESIEIACEVTKQMRRAVKGGIGGNQIFSPDIGPFSWDAQASLLSSMAKLKSSEAYQRSNCCNDAWDSTNCYYSPTYSTKTSIRKEAKKCLSDRWKKTHQYQHPSQDANSFSTLGDTLALSDKEAVEHVFDQCRGKAFTSNPLEESVSHVSSCEDDQPSPVSVLESSLNAEDGCSGGFEKISADLQGKEAKFSVELRMQLRLLKMEATGNAEETELAQSSDDGISASCKPLNEAGQMSDTLWDADERDFAYVLDMLTCLGIQTDEQDFLLNACFLWEYPAGSNVYDVLEKKYRNNILWPQSERRLLFDLTNNALMGMPKKWQSKWEEGILHDVWGRVCRQRKEAECFQEERLMGVGWLDRKDATYQIAGELESMLGEDLLEEIAAELLL
ncbi:hypothetical protein BAE44_0022100 [Dichanthelium oligosanthes]|uniref:DUF4378 domain-containing protein n=1 Tax=Dichanthelium oligosanthes TaxID=888268 RepID=A0A1E5UVB9_9POAL|nr:hypothetical protein BAE44_0022100 [Dichanthelium oligosanthes]